MFGFITSFFVTFFYQPFFNLLVGIYLLLKLTLPQYADMGIAVIIFTIVFRIIWLPMSLASGRSEKEKKDISQKVKEIKAKYANDQEKQKAEIKSLLRQNRRIVVFSSINIGFQLLIMLMLYRIFASGLEGADLHLLYSFFPHINEPFNLVFMHKYDLAHPSFFLNAVQTVLLFIVEVVSAVLSPFPITRNDFVTVFLLPIIAFIFFAAMPSGKKLFIITTLSFTLALMVVKRLIFLYHILAEKFNTMPASLSKKNRKK